ncbi:PAS domain-containing protein [Conexibacter woesei]|uniref:PAS domain-containing protein n=1 Tax=Conexibacter woesei TaxID=191495 RepID=UPI0018C8EF3E|nr:PAS domain-containing protein [Conexibacter woesei]
MPPVSTVPVDRARPFAIDELFFSTTDAKGVIRSGNDVFARVSGLELEDLVGKAHNVVRHPDMPRAVFRTFWDALGAGRGVAAYVKNLAADGAYYWVMAFAVPAADGFVSVRLKPSSPLFEVAQRVYREVLAVERVVEGDDVRRRKPAIEAGVAKLEELLAAEGFGSYREFMYAALTAEVAARAAAVSVVEGGRGPADDAAADEDPALLACRGAEHALERLVGDLERYAELAVSLGEKSEFVLGLAEEIRLFALNAVLSSARLGEEGHALGAVAEILGRRSDEAEPAIRALTEDIHEAITLLGAMGFRISASKVMTEMVSVFLADLRESESSPASLATELTALAAALADSGERLAASITAFADRVRAIESGVRKVDGELKVVRALEVNGRVEGARLNDDAISSLFSTIAHQVTDAREQLQTFTTLRSATRADEAPREAAAVQGAIRSAADAVQALAAA